MRTYKVLFLAVFFLASTLLAFAEDDVAKVLIKGNKAVSEAQVFSKIKLRSGTPYNENIINADVKELYSTGYFDSVDVDKSTQPEGVVVTYNLKEKPVVSEVVIQGNKKVRRQRLLETISALKVGAFVDDYIIEEAIRKLKDYYKKKGFNRAQITHKLDTTPEGKTKLTFIITENKVFKVERINVEGNATFSDKRVIKVIKTRPKWLFNWSSFKEDVLQDDKKRLLDFYRLQGFSAIEADLGYEYTAKGVIVNIKVKEGFRSFLGHITLAGNQNILMSQLKKVMELREGQPYSEQVVYEESSRLREAYMEKGYVFARINPVTSFNPQTQKVDLNFDIAEDDVAYINTISIKGNVRTKDKIIRRELRVYPGERFDGKKVKRSKERLENLDYFKEVNFENEPNHDTKKVDLTVDVVESKTGYFSFGGGYSSVDSLMGFVELRQRNFDIFNWGTFTGAGEDMSISTSLGSVNKSYNLSFTHPWIFDTPYAFGFDVFLRDHKRDDDTGYLYRQGARGGSVRLGREFTEYISGSLAYRIERDKISDVAADAAQVIKDIQGTTDLMGLIFTLAFDTRDNVNNPHRGMVIANTFEIYGGPFGGDADFYKDYISASYFIPLIKKSTLELRSGAGFANYYDDSADVPLFERFYAGGASSIRGYEERGVSPIDAATGDVLGGESIFLSTIEYTYPIVDFFKLAAFYDCGNVWSRYSDFLSSKLYRSFGLGVRVKTPVGPISVDYGIPLDKAPGKNGKDGRFHFNVSRGF